MTPEPRAPLAAGELQRVPSAEAHRQALRVACKLGAKFYPAPRPAMTGAATWLRHAHDRVEPSLSWLVVVDELSAPKSAVAAMIAPAPQD